LLGSNGGDDRLLAVAASVESVLGLTARPDLSTFARRPGWFKARWLASGHGPSRAVRGGPARGPRATKKRFSAFS